LVDVIVVGAGLAGLSAARRLEDHGLSIGVLEASGIVGGHTRSHLLGGQLVDCGAENFSKGHLRVRRLAEDLGLGIRPSAFKGIPVSLWRLGDREKVGYRPPLSPAELPRAARLFWRLRRLAHGIPPEAPWRAPDAIGLDSLSFYDWAVAAGAREPLPQLLRIAIGGFATVPIERLSTLQVAWWISRAGGVSAALRAGLEWEIEEGTQALATGLAGRLQRPVALDAAISRINQDDDGVEVVAENGSRWQARRAVVCIPLPLVTGIRFDPPLDEQLAKMHSELEFGRATKILVTPREQPTIRHRLVLGGKAVPTGWIRGRAAVGLCVGESADQPPESLLSDLAAAFDFDRDDADVEIVEWNQEKFSGGSYVAWAPGQLTRFGPHLRRPHRHVYFATSDRGSWAPNMEGALESGTEVADAIAHTLVGLGSGGRAA
jgi:monoamine oxidase